MRNLLEKLSCFLVVSFLLISHVQAQVPTAIPLGSGGIISVRIDAQVGSIRLTGFGPPNGVVTFLMGGSVMGTQIICPGGPPSLCLDNSTVGFFDKTFTGIYPGIYDIGVYATDVSNPILTTPIVTRTIIVLDGEAKVVDPITLPPTLAVVKATMKRPDRQSAFGMARPNSSVRIFYNNANPFPQDKPVDNYGNYAETSTRVLPLGNNFATAFVQGINGAISESSKIVTFRVEMSADLNLDTLVDILDFSRLMNNYGQPEPDDWAADINDDTLVDLVDFSIMMFNWSS